MFGKLNKKNKEGSTLQYKNENTKKSTQDEDQKTDDIDFLESQIRSIGWYKDITQKTLISMLAVSIYAIFITVVALALFFIRPSPSYFAVTPEMNVKELTPLDKPTMSKEGLMDWTSNVLINTLSLDFVHWRKQLQDVRDNYTDEGFASMFKALKESGNLNYMADERLTIHAVSNGAPVLLNSGIIKGRKAWRIQIPIQISYESSEGTPTTQNLVATILVRRVTTLDYPKGIAIEQIIIKHGR